MNQKGFFRPRLCGNQQIETLKLRNLRRETLNLIPMLSGQDAPPTEIGGNDLLWDFYGSAIPAVA